MWCRAYSEAGVGGQQLEAVLHVDELALNGSVVAAKVVQRCIQLLQARTHPLSRGALHKAIVLNHEGRQDHCRMRPHTSLLLLASA